MKKIFVVITILLLWIPCTAQSVDSSRNYFALSTNVNIDTGEKNNSVMGTVIDIVARNPIEKAVVEVMGTGLKATTSKDGQFKISNLEEGFYQIRAMAEGYEQQTQNNLYVGGGKPAAAFFMLKKAGESSNGEIENGSPVPISTKSPTYPEEARKNKVEGIFYFSVRVSATGAIIMARCGDRNVFAEEGKLSNQQVIDKYPQAVNQLEKEALDALWQWKFKPAMKDGRPIESSIIIPIKFNLGKN